MAQMNHNASYLTVVDGITVWERLRVIRNFLTDRHTALALAEMELEKNQKKLKSFFIGKYKKREIEIYLPQSLQLIQEAKDEIAFLEKLEAELAKQAEESRISGKTDAEMYEINYFEELVQIQLLEAQSEMMAIGHVSPNTMKTLIKNPRTMERAVEIGLLSTEALRIAQNSKACQISMIGGNENAKLAHN